MTTLSLVKVTDPSPSPIETRTHHPDPGSKKFKNPWPSFSGMKPPTAFAAANFRGEIRPRSIPSDISSLVGWQKPDLRILGSAPKSIKACWLGHASFLLEMPAGNRSRGLRILFDPILSQRCSPVQFMGGPKRYTQPPIGTVDEFPEIDVVCISHNHYDHLDYTTVLNLERKFKPHWVVSLGNKAWFTKYILSDTSRITELDWWDERDVVIDEHVVGRIGYLPAQHFSGRSLTDQGETLWGSYSISSMGKKVWFAGDTARRTHINYESEDQVDALPSCPAHREIGTLRGPFDLAMIPIGAYLPRHLMSPVHVDPKEAVEIFEEVNAKEAVGMHWATFGLSGEDALAPRETLRRICKERGVTGFDVWNMGEVKVIEHNTSNSIP